jgi:leucyl/phenylalanyl-tRNA--protein transferase
MNLPGFTQLTARLWFPEPRTAVTGGEFDGLVAIGGDLSVPRLLLAYRSGIFPWTDNPIMWWSPDPRAIFEFDRFHVSESLARVIRKRVFSVTIDHAFRQVVEACAAPAPGRKSTWISPAFIEAYARLHKQGRAHSVECWQDNRLVGGIYGVAIGGLFAGESMFHRVSNASKVALYHLIQHLRGRGFSLFDIQILTPITHQLGAITISREEYLRRLAVATGIDASFSMPIRDRSGFGRKAVVPPFQ